MADEQTDLERTRAMFERAGVAYEEKAPTEPSGAPEYVETLEWHRAGDTTLRVRNDDACPRVGGYGYFYVEMHFAPDGAFRGVGTAAWGSGNDR